MYEIPDFSFIKRNRKRGKGGGVAMYIPNNIIWNHREDLENSEIECIWVEICPNMAKSFLIGCLYRPPDSSCYLSRNWKDAFSDMLTKVSKDDKETILLGDFNVNYIKKNDHREEKDLIASHGFKQLIKDPTRVTSDSTTLIDVLLSNRPLNISKTSVVPLSLSDHDCIACVRKVNNAKIPSREVTSRNYKDYDPHRFTLDLLSYDWQPLYTSTNVNDAWGYCERILQKTINRHAPLVKKRVKGRDCPWLSTEVKVTMNNRDKILRKARKTRKEEDWKTYRQLKNRCNNMIKHAKRKYYDNLFRENSKTPSKFWKTIKKIFPKKEKSNISLNLANKADRLLKANSFCSFFSTIAIAIKKTALPLKGFAWKKPLELEKSNKVPFKFKHVSKSYVENQLKTLKRRKAVGIDEIPPGMLKDAAVALSGPLSFIINLSLESCTVSKAWKIAKV